MSVTAVAVAICLALATGAAAAERRGPGNARYEIATKWHADTAVLDGTERIGFENTRASKIGSVWLRLWPNGIASCAHPRVTVEMLSGGSAGKQAAACTAQKVRLAHEVAPGKRAAIKLRFRIRVPSRNGSFGQAPGGPALLGNALPILAVTDGGGTHLEPYSPSGEAGYSLASSWRVKLDLPPGLKAATTGVQTAGLRFEAPHARDFELAIGGYHVHTTTAGGVRIRLFDTLPAGGGTDRLRSDALAAARGYLRGYEQRFGDYDAPELDIVQSDSIDGEGMEFPELVFVQMTPFSNWEDTAGLLAHEIAHQWFYGMVGNNQAREPWLDESFATFASGFPDHACTPGDPLAGFPSSVRLTSGMRFFDANPDRYYYRGLYGGGACALKDLRGGLGTQRFEDLLRNWVTTHRNRIATTGALVAAIRAAAPSGFDVDAFLEASRIDVR